MCAVMRNEANNAVEWVKYHAALGVSLFVLYDDRSNDGTADVLKRTAKELSAWIRVEVHHAGTQTLWRRN